MAENIIPLPNGYTVITDQDREKASVFKLADLYSYRLVDDGSDVIKGEGKYVPNVDDLVIIYDLGMFRVSRVDYTSYVADLELWELPKSGGDVGVVDVLLGVGTGYTSETWRAMLDTRKLPYTLDVDGRLHMYSDLAKEFRVFKGIDITQTGEVISAYYNASNEYVNDAIPLKTVGTDVVTNLNIKAPTAGYSTVELEDGALVTAVFYSYTGAILSIAKLLIHNTNVIRHPDDSVKRIKSIEIISPYLSTTEPNVLNISISATVATLALRAKVTYIDGSTSIQDVVDEDSNGKMKLLGLKYWSPTITGRYADVTLSYAPSEGEEFSYSQGVTYAGTVTVPYQIRGLPADPSYSLKLFVFPSWISNLQGYTLEYWLYDLNRQVARRVPKAAVELHEDSMPFDGLEYTSVQTLKFGVNLSVVDTSYGSNRHVQTVQIALQRDGGLRATNWKVKFASNQPGYYGTGVEAIIRAGSSGLSTVNLKCGAVDKAAWLKLVFEPLQALYDPQTEVSAPAPTHFIVTTKTRVYEFPISQWANDLTFINDLQEGETLYVKFLKRNVSGDLQLAVAGFPTHSV